MAEQKQSAPRLCPWVCLNTAATKGKHHQYTRLNHIKRDEVWRFVQGRGRILELNTDCSIQPMVLVAKLLHFLSWHWAPSQQLSLLCTHCSLATPIRTGTCRHSSKALCYGQTWKAEIQREEAQSCPTNNRGSNNNPRQDTTALGQRDALKPQDGPLL